ncbi:MAG: hypothetical protein H6Q30_2529, partial [Bacteroidetes bacterium]|nr:hypothetical protein [Bacteroidota bacterium]
AADGVPEDVPKHIGDFIQSLVNLGLVGYETERTQNLVCR